MRRKSKPATRFLMVRSPLSFDLSQVSTLTSFLEKLDDELFKALQLTDVHTAQYQERLGASVNLITLLKSFARFCTSNKNEDGSLKYKADLARVALRLVTGSARA